MFFQAVQGQKCRVLTARMVLLVMLKKMQLLTNNHHFFPQSLHLSEFYDQSFTFLLYQWFFFWARLGGQTREVHLEHELVNVIHWMGNEVRFFTYSECWGGYFVLSSLTIWKCLEVNNLIFFFSYVETYFSVVSSELLHSSSLASVFIFSDMYLSHHYHI